jgi:Domain of unknown function (DUF4156)
LRGPGTQANIRAVQRVRGWSPSSLVLVVASQLVLSGCSGRQLDPNDPDDALVLERRRYIAVGQELPPNCRPIGEITGVGRGGDSTSHEDKMNWAQDELREQAEQLGANYVQMNVPEVEDWSVTISGRALLCNEAMAAEPAPPPPSFARTENVGSGNGDAASETPSQAVTPVEAPPEAPLAAGAPSIEERLKRLEDLHEKKLITDEEYKKRREEIISSL